MKKMAARERTERRMVNIHRRAADEPAALKSSGEMERLWCRWLSPPTERSLEQEEDEEEEGEQEQDDEPPWRTPEEQSLHVSFCACSRASRRLLPLSATLQIDAIFSIAISLASVGVPSN